MSQNTRIETLRDIGKFFNTLLSTGQTARIYTFILFSLYSLLVEMITESKDEGGERIEIQI